MPTLWGEKFPPSLTMKEGDDMKRIILVLLLVGSWIAFSGQSYCAESDIEGNLQISSKSNISKPQGIDKNKKKSVKNDKWHVESYVSPIDDSKTIMLSVTANKPVQGSFGLTTPKLMITCGKRGPQVLVMTGTPILFDSIGNYGAMYFHVTIRFDKEEARTLNDMNNSEDYRTLYFNDPADIIKQILTHESLLFQFTPVGSSPVITTFDIRGLKAAITPFESECRLSEL